MNKALKYKCETAVLRFRRTAQHGTECQPACCSPGHFCCACTSLVATQPSIKKEQTGWSLETLCQKNCTVGVRFRSLRYSSY
uniref:Uncharacterized protein n=1 Tax=Anguilla anguilla TaxID=7936 RepID=A0A0E9TY70_ANGAN